MEPAILVRLVQFFLFPPPFFPSQRAFAENREKEISKPHRFSMIKLLTLFDEGGNPGHQVQFDLVVKFIRLEIDTST